jgi:heme exporter protein B
MAPPASSAPLVRASYRFEASGAIDRARARAEAAPVRPAAALVARDLRLALRSGGGAGLGLAFFLVAVLLVPLGVGPDPATLARVAPGTLWIAALLACLLSLDRLFQADHEDGTLDVLALAPLPLELVVAAKALAHWLTTGLPLVLVAPLLGVTLQLPGPAYFWLVASLAAGTPALSFLGAIGAAVTVGIRRGGLLLSILVLPLYVPTLIFGARTIADAATSGGPASAFLPLCGLTLATLGFAPFAAARALRVNLR